MVQYRSVPASVYRDAGFQSKKAALIYLKEHRIYGHRFRTVEEFAEFLRTAAENLGADR
jgi:hypothetical protein